MNECLALAVSVQALNLNASSPLERISFQKLCTKTRMILELADRTISTPTGIAEDVFVKVGTTFLEDGTCPIDVHGSDFLMEEIDEFLEHDDSIPPGVDGIYDSEGDTVYLRNCKVKSSCDDPPDLELKDLPSHLEYAFLEVLLTIKILMEENAKPVVQHQRRVNPKIHEVIIAEVIKLLDDGLLPYLISPWVSSVLCVPKKGGITVIPIDPLDQEKTTFTCPYGTFAYRRMPFGLCNALGTFQRCMVAIFHDMIEKTMEVFMDDFSVFGDSFSSCLSYLDKMLQMCEDTNLVLNWEKCHFMVKEGIVLGHKISKSGIEVDKSKVDVIAKLPHPTTVKGIRSFLGHVGFYR
ncbi:reverse transcriptase domain-containing protein [Tanacetum coccineum]